MIVVFGNEYLADDSLAIAVAEGLGEPVMHCVSPEQLLDFAPSERIIILDVVKDIEKPVLISDIDELKTRTLVSLHDFDVGFFLQLMKAMGITNNITIIGIPLRGNADAITQQVKPWIPQLKATSSSS